MTEQAHCPEKWLAPQRPATERTFVGRERSVGKLVRALEAGFSAALLGPGGIGKTSALRAIERALLARGSRSVVVISARHGDTTRAFAEAVVAELGKLRAASPRGRRAALALASNGQLKAALETLENAAPAPSHGRPIVLLDDAHRLSSEERGELWSALNRVVDNGTAVVLIAGRPPFWDEAHAQVSCFWDLLQPKVTLGPFSPDETDALCRRAAALGVEVAPGGAEAAHFQSEGYPYALCHVLYRHALELLAVTPESVERIGNQPDVVEAVSHRRKQDAPVHSSADRSGAAKPRRARIFVHSSPQDRGLAGELRKHLSPLRSQAQVAHPFDILPGAALEAETSARIDEADVLLALLSADYFMSDDCQRQLARAKAAGGRVIPVLVRPCAWKETSLRDLSPLPEGERAVTEWENADAAWFSVVSGLRRLLGPGP